MSSAGSLIVAKAAHHVIVDGPVHPFAFAEQDRSVKPGKVTS